MVGPISKSRAQGGGEETHGLDSSSRPRHPQARVKARVPDLS